MVYKGIIFASTDQYESQTCFFHAGLPRCDTPSYRPTYIVSIYLDMCQPRIYFFFPSPFIGIQYKRPLLKSLVEIL